MYLFINGQAFVTTVLYTCTVCYGPNSAFKFFWKVCIYDIQVYSSHFAQSEKMTMLKQIYNNNNKKQIRIEGEAALN